MRIAARVLGLLFLLAAALVLGADLAASGDGSETALEPLGALWYSLSPASLNLVQAVIERYVWEPLWDPVLITALQWPAAAAFAVLGAVLTGVSFLRRPVRDDKAGDGNSAEPRAGAAPRS
jgi:hypothetical protein